jgi:hypothetical protein
LNLDELGVQAVLEARLHTAERNPARTLVASRLARLPDEVRDVLLASMMLELAGDDIALVKDCIGLIALVSEALDDELGVRPDVLSNGVSLPTLTAALAVVAMKYVGKAAAGANAIRIEPEPY